MTPFEKFFAGEWQHRLEQVEIPGMPDASWDRKAAWLLWCEMGNAPIRYFYHPESDSLFITTDGSFPTDGLVEEIDAEEYQRVRKLADTAPQRKKRTSDLDDLL